MNKENQGYIANLNLMDRVGKVGDEPIERPATPRKEVESAETLADLVRDVCAYLWLICAVVE
jgi:hypothetical protein